MTIDASEAHKALAQMDRELAGAQGALDQFHHRTAAQPWDGPREFSIEDLRELSKLEARLEMAHVHQQQLREIRKVLDALAVSKK